MFRRHFWTRLLIQVWGGQRVGESTARAARRARGYPPPVELRPAYLEAPGFAALGGAVLGVLAAGFAAFAGVWDLAGVAVCGRSPLLPEPTMLLVTGTSPLASLSLPG